MSKDPEIKSQIIKAVICVIVGLLAIYGTGKLCSYIYQGQQKSYTQGFLDGFAEGNNIPKSINESQEILKSLGFYKGKIDGLWGKESDRAYCDYCATQNMRKARI